MTILLTGCVGGTAFVRPPSEALQLGKTSYDQIVKTYGDARRTATLVQNNVSIKQISYSHSLAIPYTTKLSTRGLVYSFYEGILVGYDYASSFEEDKVGQQSRGDQIRQIKTGDERVRVLTLLGKPDGEFIFPMTNKKDFTSVRYSFIQSHRIPFLVTPKISTNVTTITFDEKNIVVAIDSRDSKPD
jgi:hypothetical protein